MKLCKEELTIIKDFISNTLESYCTSIESCGAKDLAYMSVDKFNGMDSHDLKWAQLVLRKTIQELVELNGK